ncbi:expressed unknown protein [Seminavis robusta]|uniref:Uncharacterized protein n=1 Tax=Seminavis robusta TaxID=568900 RepID=A0A9N8HWT7_9STRA|nr:expressed unknown protein [Seminavis robusta]|eukprot:Sro2269_g321370.1 n/a (735) ;mRNA; f:9847-12209
MLFQRALVPWLLLIAALATTANGSDTCHTFGTDGACADSADFITSTVADGVGQLISSSNDTAAQSVYDQFLEPLLLIASHLPADEEMDVCFGDFDGAEFHDNDNLEDLGCDKIPLVSGTQFGTLAGSFDVSPELQATLYNASLWTNTEAANQDNYEPEFCVGMRIPSDTCHKFTFGISANADGLTTLHEVSSALGVAVDGGVGGALVSFLSALSSTVVSEEDTVTFAASYGGGLDVQAKYYSGRHFHTNDFHAHLYFSYQGAISIPNVGDDVVSIDGPYARAFNFGTATTEVETAFDTMSSQLSTVSSSTEELISGMNAFLSNYPEVVSADKIAVNLESVTRGLFAGFSLEDTEIKALKLPATFNGVNAGFSMHATAEFDSLKKVVETICTDMEGVLILVSGRGCTDLDSADVEEGTIGFEIQPAFMELTVQWTGFWMRCRIKYMNTNTPNLHCQINWVAFAIYEEDNGYIIGKSKNMGHQLEEEVTRLSKDAVEAAGGKFRKSVAVASKLSSQVNEKAAKSVAAFYGGSTPVTFNFEEYYKCKSSTRLFSSRARSSYKNYFSQLGHDDSMSSCFEACYQYAEKHYGDFNKEDFCCEYEELRHGFNDCRVGHEGREHVSDHKKYATVTFKDEYEAMVDAKQLGSACSLDSECTTGACHEHRCKLECDNSHKCFPSANAKCFGQNDACIDVNGISHICLDGVCECDSSTGQCHTHHFGVLSDGLVAATTDDREVA